MIDDLDPERYEVPDQATESFVPSDELQAALDKAKESIRQRSFSGRNPELGKMIKCQVCNLRHRENERKCEQKFTNRVGDYVLYTETVDANGEVLVTPAYRTAIQPDQPPTRKQVVGAAAFAGKRWHPHPSKFNLQLIEITRFVFDVMGFSYNTSKEQFAKDLHESRVLAEALLRLERKMKAKEVRLRQDQSRRINRG